MMPSWLESLRSGEKVDGLVRGDLESHLNEWGLVGGHCMDKG